MTHEKDTLLQELDTMRAYLWGVLDDFDPDLEIYPGWTKREFFAHIAGWEAMVYETIRDYTNGLTPLLYHYKDLNEANADFVGVRQSARLETAKLEAEINRFAIKTLLQAIPAESYEEEIQFPWGMETLTNFLRGAIDHEQKHAADIIKVKQQGYPTSKGQTLLD